MKSTILLATALFLAAAPSPDSKSVSEMSAGFLIADDSQGLMAADTAGNGQATPDKSYELVVRPAISKPAGKASKETKPETTPEKNIRG